MIRVPEHIKFLILKWRQAGLTEAEQAELDAWYDKPLPEVLYIEGQDEEQTKARLLRQIQREIGDEEKKTVRLSPILFKVAAAVLLVLGAALFFSQYQARIADSSVATHTVSSQSRIRKIILPDSSIVWLKKNSYFSYPETFGKYSRTVILNGEALFEVAHNKHAPFIIKSGNYTTTVLGTSFNLKTSNLDDYAISVLTGKVEVAKKGAFKQTKVFLVSANQTFHADARKEDAIRPVVEEAQIKELVKGTQYEMAFEKTPFEQIMKRFEEKFDVQFEGYTGEYNACVVTADLTNISLEKSLQILCSSINATYKINHNKIKLTGGGCF